MRKLLLISAAVLVLSDPRAALAQDHSGHSMPAAAPASAEPPMDHSTMDHSTMDHSQAAETANEPVSGAGESCVVSLEQPAQIGTVGGQASVQMACTAAAHAAPAMDHSQMDHSQMAGVDRAQMDHSQMGHSMAEGPAEGSGTARLPQAEGMMPGVHFDIGSGWMGMAHGYAWGVYTDQSGPRGDHGVYVQSMAMLMAEKPFDWGRLQLKGMFSAEPLMGARGYPNLFATGETAGGQPLVDRQHPHDAFMELAARIDVNVAPDTTAFLYGGPVGEPALGPSAFMHRASSRLNPEAPITHHWFDSTHITYGVVTAGVSGRLWQLEASAFRGQEPDEARWDIETPVLNSWSVRATLNPSPKWALQVSHGWLKQPEALHPGEDEARTTASVHYNSGHGLAAMAAFSAKNRQPGNTLTAWLAEANWDFAPRHTVFGRFENVANDELFPDHADPLHERTFRVSKLQAGYAYTLPVGPFGLSLGGSVATFVKPDALDPVYGEHPLGYTLFAKLTLGH
jgi:hypothetical protein